MKLIAIALVTAAAWGQAITGGGAPTSNPNQVFVTTAWLYAHKMSFAGAWSGGATYNSQDVVSYNGAWWLSLAAGNGGNLPSTQPTWWIELPGAGGGGGGGGGGSLAIQGNGSAVGTASTLNFIPGTGLVNSLTASGGTVNVQQDIDTGLIPTLAGVQSGGPTLCASSSGSGSTYTCVMSPTLQAYTAGMVLNWRPDHNGAGGATTLNVDTIAAIALKEADGATNPTSSDIVAGRLYGVWYDGTVFRLPPSGGGGGGSSAATIQLPIGGYNDSGAGGYPAWATASVGVHAAWSLAATHADFGASGSPSQAYSFRWPSNWDNTQPVTIVFATADTNGGGGNFQLDWSVSCIPNNTQTNVSITYGSVLSTGSYVGSINTKEFSLSPLDVTTSSCAAGQFAVIQAQRNNSISSNSGDPLSLFAAALEVATH